MKFCVTSSYTSSKLTLPAKNFILEDDNATSYHGRIVTAYKQANSIIIEEGPARSPDVNVTEHAWDLLQRAVDARLSAPNRLAELSGAVQEEWKNLHQNEPRRLGRIVPNRCREVIQVSLDLWGVCVCVCLFLNFF